MKRNKLLYAMLFLLLFIIQGKTAIAQSSELLNEFNAHAYHSDWKIYKQTEQLNIYYKYSDCSDIQNGIYPEFLLFKVENLTQDKLYTYWNWEFAYDGRIMSREGSDENLVQLTLEPKLSLEASCDFNEYSILKIYIQDKQDSQSSKLTAFSILDLNIFEL